MTDEETEKLKKTIEDVRKQYYADVEKLKEKANKKILAAIPLEKREKLKELTGEFYDREKGTRRTFSALQEAKKKKAQGDSENDKDDEREN